MPSKKKYELVPPDGGWGFVVVLGFIISVIVTSVPVVSFGMVFGDFLSELGDEASGTAISNCVNNGFWSLTGFAANILLQRFSSRKVGMLGALFFSVGAFGTIFVTNLWQLVFSFGVLQGIGIGLIDPACYVMFNAYFDKKRTFMMSTSYVLAGLANTVWPGIVQLMLEAYGFRGTLAIKAALALNCFLGIGTFQPPKWHAKRVVNPEEFTAQPEKVYSVDKIDPQGEALLSSSKENATKTSQKNSSLWSRISKALDLALFKDPIYINIVIGLSLSMISTISFISLLPLLLGNAGLNKEEVTIIITIYFGAGLVGRIIFSTAAAFIQFKSRNLFYAGSLLSAILRVVFVMNDSFVYLACISAALGSLRCLFLLPLVLAEAYLHRFITAFTLFTVVNGMISLLFGPFLSLVKSLTGSDVAVVHVLTAAYLGCVIPWTVEYFINRRKTKPKIAESNQELQNM